jgi:hypothetical protein
MGSRARRAINFIVMVKRYSSKLLAQLKDERDVVKLVGISFYWHTKVKTGLWVEATPFAHGRKPLALTPK